jgi:hypothetical protein
LGSAFWFPEWYHQSLPSGFSFPAAYGDLFTAILAVLAIWSLSRRAWFATSMAWVFNVWGAVDLLMAFYEGLLGVNIDPGWLSAAYFIPTVLVPPLLVTHGLMFWLLLRKPSSTRHQANATPKLAPS